MSNFLFGKQFYPTKYSSNAIVYILSDLAGFFKWANHGLFFHFFHPFQTNITIFTTNKCEKCPSSIRRRDSNSQPSDYKSPPLTTRPGFPPSDLAGLNEFYGGSKMERQPLFT